MAEGSTRFKRLPGAARRYLDLATGLEVSRRQRDILMDLEGGGRQRVTDVVKLAERRRQMKRYQSLVDDYQDKLAAQGKQLNRQAIRTDKEFKALVKDLNKLTKQREISKTRPGKKPSKKSGGKVTDADLRAERRANDKLKKLLIELGRRQGIADWVPVGWSDAFRAGRIKSRANLPKHLR
jgi:hypothetical protein